MPSDKYSELRKKARERVSHLPRDLEQMSPQDLQALLYEFDVHRAELEVQNEELRQAQQELEKIREKYFDLYELAPVAYLSLDEKGIIKEANLSAAKLFHVERRRLIRKPFSSLVTQDDRRTFASQFNEIMAGGKIGTLELTLQKENDNL
jgi:PAS domain-containing protein